MKYFRLMHMRKNVWLAGAALLLLSWNEKRYSPPGVAGSHYLLQIKQSIESGPVTGQNGSYDRCRGLL